jgi:hypothetical protein
MRRALVGMILAATVLTPFAAQAQRFQNESGDRVERMQQRSEQRAQRQSSRSEASSQRQQSSSDDSGQRQQRQAQRQARQQQRAERQAQQATQVQAGAGAQVVQRERSRGGGRNVGERSGACPQAWQGNPNDPMRRHYEEVERRNQYRYGTREQREQVRQEWRDERRGRDGDGRGDWNRGDRDGRGWNRGDGDRRNWSERRNWGRDWNRSWRNDRRYNWSDYRYRYRDRYRLGRYYSPYNNWSYSRFSIGFFLQPLFYSQRYWIGDPYYYRLPPAPPGTQWVRYYNDVVLVDVYTGEVVDVIYNFFW